MQQQQELVHKTLYVGITCNATIKKYSAQSIIFKVTLCQLVYLVANNFCQSGVICSSPAKVTRIRPLLVLAFSSINEKHSLTGQ